MTYDEALSFLQVYVDYLGNQALVATPEGRAFHEKFKAAVEAVRDPQAAHWKALTLACEAIGKAAPVGSDAPYLLCAAIDRLTEAIMGSSE